MFCIDRIHVHRGRIDCHKDKIDIHANETDVGKDQTDVHEPQLTFRMMMVCIKFNWTEISVQSISRDQITCKLTYPLELKFYTLLFFSFSVFGTAKGTPCKTIVAPLTPWFLDEKERTSPTRYRSE